MSLKRNFKSLLLKMSQDPTLRTAIESLRAEKQGAGSHFTSLPNGFWQIISLSTRFVGKRRARVIADVIDIVTFFVALSLVIKQNIFDRPEVQEFFGKIWQDARKQGRAAANTVRVKSESARATVQEQSQAVRGAAAFAFNQAQAFVAHRLLRRA